MPEASPNKDREPGTPGRPTRQVVYERLAIQIEEVRERLGGLPSPVEAEGIWRGIWFEEAHHSTAIEGNTLALRQVEALLADGRAVGDRELREYMEVPATRTRRDGSTARRSSPARGRARIDVDDEVRRVHEMTMAPVWGVAPIPATSSEVPGAFRQHDIEPFRTGMSPPPWTDVAPQ